MPLALAMQGEVAISRAAPPPYRPTGLKKPKKKNRGPPPYGPPYGPPPYGPPTDFEVASLPML